MDNLSPYRLTLVAAFIVIILSTALVFILGGPTNAAPYLTFMGSVAIPALFGLFKLEQNSLIQQSNHLENQDKLANLKEEIEK